MDIPKYNVEAYNKLLVELHDNEEYVQSFSSTKAIEGQKVPKRIYQIVTLEPDAVDLDEVKKQEKKE